MKSFVAVAILALACSASATVIRSFPLTYSAPLSYYYQPSIRGIPTPLAYSSPSFLEAPKTILTKSIQTPLVWRNAEVVEAPKTTLLKGVPAPVAYHSLPEVSYAYTPIVHQKVVVAQPEARYIASNLGATHSAPLPGHLESVISQNLEPAKGTA